ncbi:hypothetical protein EMIT0P44_150023 [Pseudomonas sp. IT-P44]
MAKVLTRLTALGSRSFLRLGRIGFFTLLKEGSWLSPTVPAVARSNRSMSWRCWRGPMNCKLPATM